MSNFEKLYSKTFVDHAKLDWGCEFNFRPMFCSHWKVWEVTKVLKGKQAEALGVKAGWKIKSINGTKITAANYEEIAVQIVGGKHCEIMFEEPVILFKTLKETSHCKKSP